MASAPHIPRTYKSAAIVRDAALSQIERAVLAICEQAAEEGRPLPSTENIMGALDLGGFSTVPGIMKRLEQKGLIRRNIYQRGRQVCIIATGKCTAPPKCTAPHWRQWQRFVAGLDAIDLFAGAPLVPMESPDGVITSPMVISAKPVPQPIVRPSRAQRPPRNLNDPIPTPAIHMVRQMPIAHEIEQDARSRGKSMAEHLMDLIYIGHHAFRAEREAEA